MAFLVALLCLSLSPAAIAQTGDEIQVSVANYGLGGVAREGDWAGIQVNITDSAPQQRDIILRMVVRDADGDRAQYDRVVTANPGIEQSFWLYARLPFGASDNPPSVLAFEAIESGGATPYRAGRLLGRFDPQLGSGMNVHAASVGITAVVGPHSAGLNQYQYSIRATVGAIPFGHELSIQAAGLDVLRLPDRWQGLVAADVMVWTESTTRRTEPSALTPEKARAIRTWVERGGHLVILLPPAGDPWFGAAHPLSDILPEIERPQRIAGYDLDRARSLITESANVPLPANAVIHTFTPRDDAVPGGAVPILNTPDGDAVVIQRRYGAGAVTVVGLDLTSGPLRRFNLPDAESFWHRVLGRRGDIRRPEEFTEQEQADANTRTGIDFDHDISSAIDSTGRAVQGILFGLVVFITYWLVAGPIGYYALKRRGLHQHAWVAFVACTAAFTALAWAGATALRPKRVAVTHLTIVDAVHGQPEARARTWASVMLPDYGQSTVALSERPEDANAMRDRSTNLLAPWEPPGNAVGWNKGFPDNTGYNVDARQPDSLTVPTRATVKQFRADVTGRSDWSFPALQRTPGDLDEPEITINGAILDGTLVHDMPGPLTGIRVIISQGQVPVRMPGSPLGTQAVARTLVLRPSLPNNAWPAGQPLDLGAITTPKAIQDSARFDYFRGAIRDGLNPVALNPAAGKPLADRILSARFISQFAPPNYRVSNDTVGNRAARRFSTHGWDLGRWLTTPCVIVVGFVEIEPADASPAGSPFPFFVNNRPAPASGLTMVTWIYPLPAAPPNWPGRGPAPTPSQTTEPAAEEG
ncbi:DUF4350 domain-containing protein [Marivita sp.]|uniref:DUF4350 domain-containing protein n=1 Tax=Marivita sp. TaxID=2003365 RepID=UPI003B5C15AA